MFDTVKDIVYQVTGKTGLTMDARSDSREYRLGTLYVDPARHLVKVGGREVTLTLKEFELLCLLLEKRGAVLTRDALLTQVWGYGFDGESRTVDVHGPDAAVPQGRREAGAAIQADDQRTAADVNDLYNRTEI